MNKIALFCMLFVGQFCFSSFFDRIIFIKQGGDKKKLAYSSHIGFEEFKQLACEGFTVNSCSYFLATNNNGKGKVNKENYSLWEERGVVPTTLFLMQKRKRRRCS